MKKYEKPVFGYESFVLTASIAGSCNVIMNQAQGTCTSGALGNNDIPADYRPFTDLTVCAVPAPEDDYCYWNGNASYKGFAS